MLPCIVVVVPVAGASFAPCLNSRVTFGGTVQFTENRVRNGIKNDVDISGTPSGHAPTFEFVE